MDVRSIRYFIAVFEEKSVSSAAKRCFVAQPSISTTIAHLEEQLGVTLFLRHRKGVTPTADAQKLYKYATKLLGEFDALQELFHQAAETIPISIAVMQTIDPVKIGEFLKHIISNSENLLLRLVDSDEEADVRIVSDRLCGKSEQFITLWEEKYVLAIPRGHHLTLQTSVGLEHLNGERLIDRCLCEQHSEVAGFLKMHHIEPIVVANAKSETLAISLVSAGLGVAIVPESSVKNINNVVVRSLKGSKLRRKVGLAYDPTSSAEGINIILAGIKTIGDKLRVAPKSLS